MCVVAHAAPGDLDETYGELGLVTFDEVGAAVTDMAFNAEDQSVWAGMRRNGELTELAVWRRNQDGSLDAGFGDLGVATFEFGAEIERANAVAVQPDGKVVVVGSSGDETLGRLTVMRLDSAGQLDNGFGAGGRTVVELGTGGLEVPVAVAVQPDGR
ncbi:MAG: hypothetical protein ACLFSG_09455, partial [Halothiobacillaceae bacterium]